MHSKSLVLERETLQELEQLKEGKTLGETVCVCVCVCVDTRRCDL